MSGIQCCLDIDQRLQYRALSFLVLCFRHRVIRQWPEGIYWRWLFTVTVWYNEFVCRDSADRLRRYGQLIGCSNFDHADLLGMQPDHCVQIHVHCTPRVSKKYLQATYVVRQEQALSRRYEQTSHSARFQPIH